LEQLIQKMAGAPPALLIIRWLLSSGPSFVRERGTDSVPLQIQSLVAKIFASGGQPPQIQNLDAIH
jgi:hypothetical protein